MRLFLLLGLAIKLLFSADLVIMTEEYPPWNYEKNGEIRGISAKIVQAIQAKIGNTDRVVIRPWNRAYDATLNNPNHALFSTTRMKERENLFKWVGPIGYDRPHFFEHKEAPTRIKSFEDAKNVKLIDAGAPNNAAHIYLKNRGFTNLSNASSDTVSLKSLTDKKVNLAILDDFSTYFNLQKMGLPGSMIVKTPVQAYSSELYIAFSKSTDDATISEWQNALDELKGLGRFTALSKDGLNQAYQDFGVLMEAQAPLR